MAKAKGVGEGVEVHVSTLIELANAQEIEDYIESVYVKVGELNDILKKAPPLRFRVGPAKKVNNVSGQM